MSFSANITASSSSTDEIDGEVTRDEAMQLLLKSPELYSDITLCGSDGANVFASRNLLATRSKVFNNMLYGDFAEAISNVVRLPYTGQVLESLVSYIYTDSANLLLNDTESTSNEHVVSELAALADCATFFELPGLCRKALAVARSIMGEKNPSVAAEFLNASESYASLANSETELFAFGRIIANLEELHDDGKILAMMSSDRIAAILQNQDLPVNELTLFKFLHAWSQVQEENNRNDVDHLDCKRKASELTSHLILSNIEPTDLNGIVAPSGLVTNEQLFDAYKTQALRAARSDSLSYRTRRGPVCWRSSADVLFSCASPSHSVEFLSCRELRTGIHKWSVKIQDLCNCAWVGVASTEHQIDPRKWLGYQNGGWVYADAGTTQNGSAVTSKSKPKFGKNSVVTLTLDLTNSGTLHASVDGSPTFELFNNMLATFRDYDNVGFVPAVSLRAPGTVRFLGFR